MIKITQKGNFKKTYSFLERIKQFTGNSILDTYGKRGVDLLKAATPVDSGKTAESWYYDIQQGIGHASIIWSNSNMTEAGPVAILIQYGHGNGNGAYIEGRDYINPPLEKAFREMARELWREVTKK